MQCGGHPNPTAVFGSNVSKVLKSPFKWLSHYTSVVPFHLVLLTLPGLIQNDDPFKLFCYQGLLVRNNGPLT